MNPESCITTADQRRTSNRIVELDGIRGLAILLVLVWHYIACQVSPEPGSLAAYGSHLLALTWAGVDLFFVLSGFLIGGILMDNRAATNYYRTFYARRICRIFPLYYALLALLAVTLLMLGPIAAGSGLDSLLGGTFPLWSYASYLQNIFMAHQQTFGPRWMAVTWSLAIEEQFYLILPFVIRFVAPNHLPKVILALVLIAPLTRTYLYFFVSGSGIHSFVLLPTRWDSLFMGVLGAWALRQPLVRNWLVVNTFWVTCLFIISGLCILMLWTRLQGLFSPGMRLGGHTILALFFLCLIVGVLLSVGGWRSRLLRHPVLVWFGTVSYGVYLLHEPVVGVLHACLRGQAPRIATFSDALVTLLAVGTTLVLATLSWHWFERPMVLRGQRFRWENKTCGGLKAA